MNAWGVVPTTQPREPGYAVHQHAAASGTQTSVLSVSSVVIELL